MKITELDLTRKFRRKSWYPDCKIFYQFDDGSIYDKKWDEVYLYGHDIFADDWEYFEEKKEVKKVKRWNWIYNVEGKFCITNTFYSNEKEVREVFDNNDIKIIGPAPWSEAEFEEEEK